MKILKIISLYGLLLVLFDSGLASYHNDNDCGHFTTDLTGDVPLSYRDVTISEDFRYDPFKYTMQGYMFRNPEIVGRYLGRDVNSLIGRHNYQDVLDTIANYAGIRRSRERGPILAVRESEPPEPQATPSASFGASGLSERMMLADIANSLHELRNARPSYSYQPPTHIQPHKDWPSRSSSSYDQPLYQDRNAGFSVSSWFNQLNQQRRERERSFREDMNEARLYDHLRSHELERFERPRRLLGR